MKKKSIICILLASCLLVAFSISGCGRILNYSMYYLVDGEKNLRKSIDRKFDPFLQEYVTDTSTHANLKEIILNREIALAKALMNHSSMSDQAKLSEQTKHKLRQINKNSYYKTVKALQRVLSEKNFKLILPMIRKNNYYGDQTDLKNEFDMM